MAGDWIKIEKATARKPEVLRIAELLSVHVDHAFGLCVRFWAWCDDHMTDGHALVLELSTLDLTFGHSGFTSALVSVGWLRVRNGCLEVPNFERHLSESAKTRALWSTRKRQQRAKNVSPNCPTKSETREEKRRVVQTPKSPCESQGDFSCFASAWQTWERLQANKLTPERLGEQRAQLATLTEADAIASIRDAVARGGRRLKIPKPAKPEVDGKLFVDRRQQAETLRASVVREGRKRGLNDDQIAAAVRRTLAEKGFSEADLSEATE